VYCVWLLMRFQRSVKENDFDLYVTSMQGMCALLFTADHQNYARYLPVNFLTLTNLPDTHPGVQEFLEDNGFTVSRSSAPACQNPVDITIEQTINRSAKTAGGVIGFSRNAAAYTRWCVTRHKRASFAQVTMELADMDCNNNIQKSFPCPNKKQ